MDIQQARENVVLAGKKLLESGLIARTWGNVSCRISDHQFVITPSGKSYESLSPGDIVSVNINDGSYSGQIKPSSEKDLHAAIYKHRKDVNFIIHTHQENASALSPLGIDIPARDFEAVGSFGTNIACAAYGLPGSQKLKQEAITALARTEGKAILLAYHGAVCLGSDMEEAFQVAKDLEKACADFACHRYGAISSQEINDPDRLKDRYLEQFSFQNNQAEEAQQMSLFNSERHGECFTLYNFFTRDAPFPDEAVIYSNININKPEEEKGNNNLPAEVELHREIYRRNKKVGVVIHTTLPDILAVSKAGKSLYPLLDDFAQIIGTRVRVAEYDGSARSIKNVAGKLKGRNAVLIRGNGALCVGPNRSDAVAAEMVFEKNCKAIIYTTLLGKVKPINQLEAMLMRFIYLKKYSKKI